MVVFNSLYSFIKRYWYLILSVSIGLIIFDFSRFIEPFNTFFQRFNDGQIFYRYSFENDVVWQLFTERIDLTFRIVFDFFRGFNLVLFLNDVIEFLYKMLLYAINYGLNIVIYIYLFIYIFISKEVYDVKITRSALALIKLFGFLSMVKRALKRFFRFLFSHRKKIYMSIIIVLLFQGLLILVLTEALIFIYYYFASAVMLTTHILLFSLVKSVVIWTVINVPLWLFIIILLMFFWFYGIQRAESKLSKNHDALKAFAKFDVPYFTIINGVPSIGKTWLLVMLGLASEEVMIEDLEDQLHSIETQYPSVNFGKVLTDRYLHASEYPEHYRLYKILHRDSSFIGSVPFAVFDPYSDDLSIRLDWDWIRPNIVTEFAPLEEYTILLISELDKEYNSHYSKAEVGEDGVYIFCGVGAHLVKRHGKIIADYQQPTQVPLNLRGNADLFIEINDRRYKLPFILKFFRYPFIWLFNFFDSVVMQYESYKIRLMKNTRRTDKRVRKRYDYTFIYCFCRFLLYYLSRILSFFDSFSYQTFYCSRNDLENREIAKFKLNINTQDSSWRGSPLYDSTFLSKGYESKKDLNYVLWEKMEKWNSMAPDFDELQKIHSRFVNSAFSSSTSIKDDSRGDVSDDFFKSTF